MKHINIIEILCMTALLLLFGFTSIMVVSQGANAYEKILAKRDTSGDLRVATSYISMRVRQMDNDGGLEVREIPGGEMLVLTHPDYEGLETRIYVYENSLYEAFSPYDLDFDPLLGELVTDLDDLKLSLTDGLLSVSVSKGADSRTLALSSRTEALYE